MLIRRSQQEPISSTPHRCTVKRNGCLEKPFKGEELQPEHDGFLQFWKRVANVYLSAAMERNEEGTTHEQSRCLHESDPRRGHAGAGTAGRGPPRRLRARRLGDALRPDGAGPE